MSDNNVAAGTIGGGSTAQAAVRELIGSVYVLTILAPVGSRTMGINRAGTLIVGASNGVAAYWQRQSGGGWSPPITLPGNCGLARAVDDLGRIAANNCPNGNRSGPAVFVVPYSTTTMIRLGGLGPQNAGYVEGMSPSGNYLVGHAGTRLEKGVYWQLF